MKAISIGMTFGMTFALALAVVFSTPALARKADHHKHVRHHHRHVVVDPEQAFGSGPMGVSAGWGWDTQQRAPRAARRAARSDARSAEPGNAPSQGAYASMVARHAAANGVPTSLVHRVIMRESRYNPRAVSKGNYGMMQIKLGTARAMGYSGSAAGLLDPEVNMTYAVKYLAGAYKAAGGSESGAVANYARGYYAQAKRRGVSPYEAPGTGTFAMQTPTQGFYQEASARRTTRRGASPYAAPGYGSFAMQTSRRGVRAGRGGSYVVAPMTADRHMVF